jgi:hypothetical protein
VLMLGAGIAIWVVSRARKSSQGQGEITRSATDGSAENTGD